MKTIAFSLFFVVVGFSLKAQTLESAIGGNMGSIEPDGTFRSPSGQVIKKIPSYSGTIKNSDGRSCGEITSDGTIYGCSGRVVGKIDSDGIVKDGGGNSIGKISADGNVSDNMGTHIGYGYQGNRRQLAVVYFFSKP